MGKSGVVGFTKVRAGLFEFIGGRWVHSGSRLVSLGSFGVVVFTRVHAGGRWVHPGSLGSLRFALGVIWFIWGHWIHSGSRSGSLGSSGVVGFTWFRPRGRWVRSRGS